MATPVLEKTDKTAPAPSPVPITERSPFVSVRANLLPDEIVQARLADAMRRKVLIGLLAVVAVLIAWFGFSWWQTHSAQSDLDDAQAQGTQLQSQTRQFAPLLSAQTEVQAVQQRLRTLMVGDLQWKQMLSTLRSTAPSGVSLTQITGSITVGTVGSTTNPPSGSGSAGSTGTPGTGTTGTVGSLPAGSGSAAGVITITGSAKDNESVAAYADALGKVRGLANPFITSVTASGKAVTFGLTVVVTTKALGGRYAAVTTASGKGGK